MMRPAPFMSVTCLLAALRFGTPPPIRASRTGNLPGSVSGPAQGALAASERELAWALVEPSAAEGPPAAPDVLGEVEDLCCSEREEDSLSTDAVGLAVDRRRAALPSLDGTPRGEGAGSLLRLALDYAGVPYRWGGATKCGVDRSGLIVRAAADLGQRLPRWAARLHDLSEPVAKGTLPPGDLVFFADTYKPGISHVGIYEGGTSFLHASSSAGRVTLGDVDDPYSQSKYAGAGRLSLSGDRAEPAPEPQPLGELVGPTGRRPAAESWEESVPSWHEQVDSAFRNWKEAGERSGPAPAAGEAPVRDETLRPVPEAVDKGARTRAAWLPGCLSLDLVHFA